MTFPSIPMTIHARKDEAVGIVSLDLRPTASTQLLPPFHAGAHIDLHLPIGLRSYSLINSPMERHRYVIAIGLAREGRGGSKFVHETLIEGRQVDVSPPRSAFSLEESPHIAVLIAGGIGITPILCMYDELTRRGQPTHLLYCARSREFAAFARRFDRHSDVEIRYDDESAGPADLEQYMAQHSGKATFYCCGPAPMLLAFRMAAERLQIEPTRIRFENFGANELAAEARAMEQGTFEVTLARRGLTLTVARSESILDVLLAAGVDVESSCREGNCGACEVAVIAGLPEHRDMVLSAAERASNATMMICVSGCKGDRLTLDV